MGIPNNNKTLLLNYTTIFNNNNKLQLISNVSCGGKSSCYLIFDKNLENIININYWDSSITVHPIENFIVKEYVQKIDPSVKNTITFKEEYKSIIDYLSSHYFNDIQLDKGALKLSQMWFISYDPDVYVNLEVCIDVSEGVKCVSQGIIQSVVGNNTLFYAPEREIMYLSITEIDTHLITKTKYINKSDIDIDTIPWTDIKIPRNIGDGYKRKLFTYYTHALFHLNPETDPKWIFAYVYNVNRNCADPKMSYRDLLSLFNMQYGYIKSDHYKYQNNRKKSLHINPDLDLTGGQKSIVANKVNGSIRKNKTKLKIAAAIEKLIKENEKHTISSISRLSGVSRKTVGCHMKDLELIDLDALINQLIKKNH